jgi:hypothetical protein
MWLYFNIYGHVSVSLFKKRILILMFGLFLKLGIHHILNFEAYDHILFVTLLTIAYRPRQWKIVLALVTAFTLGHTISLVIAALGYLSIQRSLVEWLIVITILITALENVFTKETEGYRVFSLKYWLKYGLATLFGLIHGLGFASYLQALLGREDHLIVSILSFNIGVELGQWVVVVFIMSLTFLLVSYLRMRIRIWNLTVSSLGIVISLILMVIRFPWK